jgi:membrane protease YdiL (CAAX protease family)
VSAVSSGTDLSSGTGLKGFLNKGGFGRYLIVVVIYAAIYLGAGKVIALAFPDVYRAGLLSSVGAVFVQLTFGLLVGAVVLSIFTKWMGWNSEIYGRQPIYKSWWMWIGPLVLIVPIVLRVLGTEWSDRSVDVIVAVMVTGLMVGFVEELLCRGIGVKMLRDGGSGEWVVAALTSLVFALLHALNLLSGQDLRTTAVQLAYTFGFGVLIYLTLRVTGFLVYAMVVHGLTDPTAILANGATNQVAEGASINSLVTLGGQWALVIAFVGLIMLIFIRGRAERGTHTAA